MDDVKPIAILSATVAPVDGRYEIFTCRNVPNMEGIQHFVDHPSTKGLIEAAGAVKADSFLFAGLEPGDSALVVSLKQARDGGNSAVNVEKEVTLNDLQFRIMTRIDF